MNKESLIIKEWVTSEVVLQLQSQSVSRLWAFITVVYTGENLRCNGKGFCGKYKI